MMLPAQYAMNIMALATAFLVNPAMFELIIERLMGMPAAYAMKMKTPKRLLPWFVPKRTRMLPMRLEVTG